MQLATNIVPARRRISPPLAARLKIDSQDRFRRRVHIDDKGAGTKTDYVKGAGMTLAPAGAFYSYNRSTGSIVCDLRANRLQSKSNGVPNYLHPDHLSSADSATEQRILIQPLMQTDLINLL